MTLYLNHTFYHKRLHVFLIILLISGFKISTACDYPAFDEINDRNYTNGEIISRNGKDYEVVNAIKANSQGADWVYAPGTGDHWDEAWKLINQNCRTDLFLGTNSNDIWNSKQIDEVSLNDHVDKLNLGAKEINASGNLLIRKVSPSLTIFDDSDANKNRMEIKADQSGTSFKNNYSVSSKGISMKFFNGNSSKPTLELGNSPTSGYRASVNGELFVEKHHPTMTLIDNSNTNKNRMILKADTGGTSFRGLYSSSGKDISMKFFNGSSSDPTLELGNAKHGGYKATINGETQMNGEASIEGRLVVRGDGLMDGNFTVNDGHSSKQNAQLRFKVCEEKGVIVKNRTIDSRNKALSISVKRGDGASGNDHYGLYSSIEGEGWAGYFKGDLGVDGSLILGDDRSKNGFFTHYESGDIIFARSKNGSLTEFDWYNSIRLGQDRGIVKRTDNSNDVAIAVDLKFEGDVFRVMGDGTVYATELNVRLADDFPDYVFDTSYDLMPLGELKNYIQSEKHLPNIPKASTIQKEGINVSAINRILVEKVEELTLYTIQQQELIEKLITEVEQLKD